MRKIKSKLVRDISELHTETIAGSKYASISFSMKVGSLDDGKKTGISHFLEHLLTYNEDGYFSLRKMADDLDFYTSYDDITVVCKVRDDLLEDSLRCIGNLYAINPIKKEDVNKEKEIIAHEVDYFRPYTPTSYGETLYAEIILDENGTTNQLGSKEMINTFTVKKLEEHRNKYFVKDNARLIVSSSKSEEEIEELYTKHILDKFPVAENTDQIINKMKPKLHNVNKSRYKCIPYMKTTNIEFGFRDFSEYSAKSVVCNMLESMLSNNLNSIVYKKIREEKKLAYALSYSWIVYNKNLIIKKLKVHTAGKHVNETILALTEVVREILENGYDRDDFESQKNKLIYEFSDPEFLGASESMKAMKTLIESECLRLDKEDKLEALESLTYESFMEFVKEGYKNFDFILTAEGDFDPTRCYKTTEIEDLLNGKKIVLPAPVHYTSVIDRVKKEKIIRDGETIADSGREA